MGDKDTESIEFSALVAKIATLADSTVRVTLDLPEDCIYQVAWLLAVKQEEGEVSVRVERK